MSEQIHELLKYLQIGSRLDLKDYALTQVLGLTGTPEGLELLTPINELLASLLSLLDDPNATVSKESALSLVNISASQDGATALVKLNPSDHHPSKVSKAPDNIVKTALRFIVDKSSAIGDPCCMILSNLTRPIALVDPVVELIEGSGIEFDELVTAFTTIGYNEKGAKLHYLGPLFSNLTQSVVIRRYIMDKNRCIMQKLIAFTEYPDSVVRRGGVVGTLKNCCFDEDYHEWLLGREVDILPRLLLPLAGNTEYDDEENDKLPPELQFLEENKQREEDPDIKCMLLETILQLCAIKRNREFVRDSNTYVILRELHKVEKDRKVLLACENVVDLLLKRETEIALDNLNTVEVPADLVDRFKRMDQDFLLDN